MMHQKRQLKKKISSETAPGADSANEGSDLATGTLLDLIQALSEYPERPAHQPAAQPPQGDRQESPGARLPNQAPRTAPPDAADDLFGGEWGVDQGVAPFIDEDVFQAEEQIQVQALRADHPDEPVAASHSQHPWYLGLDIGATGISAVLFNQQTGQLYPLYWSTEAAAGAAERKFRLPAVVSSATAAGTTTLHDLKSYLSLGISYYSTQGWQPIVQWSDALQFPLTVFQQALQGLLSTLPSCRALGLDDTALSTVFQQLAGIVVGCPGGANAYRFNLREIILGAKLVAYPEQIFFVEEPIATLVSARRAGRALTLPQGQNANLFDAEWQGSTVVVNAGAAFTELAIVTLSDDTALTQSAFYCRSIPYAGNGIDQDMIGQLLYPALMQEVGAGDSRQLAIAPDAFQVADFSLDALDLDLLNLPAPGEPDLANRYRLQQQLESTRSGQVLLQAAHHAKIALQQQNRVMLHLGRYVLTLLRQDLGSRVLLPYVQRLNRELNSLLSQTNTAAPTVNQVICTGGTASLSTIARWLSQKLPNATILQDTYARPVDRSIPSCSRVAYGLAVLPLQPKLLNSTRLSDYDLLLHLLRIVSNQPVSLEMLLHLLERQGVDSAACRAQVQALLDGQLPAGLVPTDLEALAPASRQNPDYQVLRVAPLFQKQGDRYRPNRYQWNQLRRYFDLMLTTTQRSLTAFAPPPSS